MAEAEAQAEIDRLRAEVESYRQREIEQLQAQLAAARQDAAHYRAEAQRISALAQTRDSEQEAEITRLRGQIESTRIAQRAAPIRRADHAR